MTELEYDSKSVEPVETSGDYRQYLSSSFLLSLHLHYSLEYPGIITIVESVNEWPPSPWT